MLDSATKLARSAEVLSSRDDPGLSLVRLSFALRSKAIGILDMAERLEAKWLLEIRRLGLSPCEIEAKQEAINRLKVKFWCGEGGE